MPKFGSVLFVWTSLYLRRQEGVPGCDRNRTGCLAPCLGIWEQKLYSGEPRVAGTCSLWEGVSELLGRPVEQMNYILAYSSRSEREQKKIRRFCRAPTPTPS